jgi:hypothetical protein
MSFIQNDDWFPSLSDHSRKSQVALEHPLLSAGAHAYNLSYSGGRDQEDHSLKLVPGK